MVGAQKSLRCGIGIRQLVECWGKSEYIAKFGRLSIYPISRRSSLVADDSILNFWEIWERGTGPVLAPDIVGYLEINEDFNLNLKSDTAMNEKEKEKIWSRLRGAPWPSGVNPCLRDYKQQVWVLYEIDFGFLANVNCLSKVVSNLGCTLEVLFGALNNDRE